jgi:L,D-transpeptidase YcbB
MSQKGLIGFGLAVSMLVFAPGVAHAQSAPPRPSNQTKTAVDPVSTTEAKVLAPAAQPADAFKPQEARDSEPTFGPESLARTQTALKFYEDIVAQGGWKALPEAARGMRQGQSGAFVQQLKNRLVVSGDLDKAAAANNLFDAVTVAAVKRFQARHGLSETGAVGKLTFSALNVPADVRLKQLRASVERLEKNIFKFAPRYVVINIPGAVVEAVSKGKVERRYLAVVGKKERQSPVISANISSVNLNPYWTVPNSIIKKDVVKALKADPAYLNKNNLRTVNWKGEEVDPNTVNWSATKEPNFILRQDPGAQNSLGQLKIDMPNSEAVYMHDTPKKELFKQDVRFHSSGCARVSDVRDLATWLLSEQGIGREQIDRDIEAGLRVDLKLKKHVPVAWVYITGYADAEGKVHFREDIYGLDTPEGIALTTLDGKKKIRPKAQDAIPVASVKAKPKATTVAAQMNKPVADDTLVTGSVPKVPNKAKPVAKSVSPVQSQSVPEKTLQPKPAPTAAQAKI